MFGEVLPGKSLDEWLYGNILIKILDGKKIYLKSEQTSKISEINERIKREVETYFEFNGKFNFLWTFDVCLQTHKMITS